MTQIEQLMYPPLQQLKRNRKQRAVLKKFLNKLARRTVRGLDPLAKKLHVEAFTHVDCMQCANCCKTMTPTWKKAEVKRVAHSLSMTYDEYFKKYLRIDKEGDVLNRSTPCQHLAPDNKCMIYEIRPTDCSGYPHTMKKGFKEFIPETHLQNINYCPATFYLVNKMFEKLEKNQFEDLKI